MRVFNQIGVVGTGNIAERHRSNIKKLIPDTKIIALSSRENYPQKKLYYADSIAKSVDDLIEKQIDCAIVAAPANLHEYFSNKFIQNGIPVLIEKPLATTISDAKKIYMNANKFKIPVGIGYCLRYLPSSNIVKKILSSGRLGRLFYGNVEVGHYLPDWRPDQDYLKSVSANKELGGGVLLELSHELDYLNWFFGPLEVIHSNLRRSSELRLDVEDCVDFSLKNDNEMNISIHLDFLQKKPHRKCRFVGTEGVLEWDLFNHKVVLVDKKNSEVIYDKENFDLNWIYIEMLKDFINLCNQARNILATPKDGVDVIDLIEKIKLHNLYQINK